MIGYGVTFKGCLFEVVWFRQCDSEPLSRPELDGLVNTAEASSLWASKDIREVSDISIAIFTWGCDMYPTNGNLVSIDKFYTNGYFESGLGRLRYVMSLKKLL